jgi:hypothetical protein
LGISTEYGLSLTAVAILAGIAWRWIFRRFSDRPRIGLVKRQVRAQLYAMRLYAAEPSAMLRAQKQLLRWNARYLALLLRPAAIAVIPGILLFTQLDHVYGRRALAPGESAIVSAGLEGSADLRTFAPAMVGSGLAIESPAVRLPDAREADWRVRVTGAESRLTIWTGKDAASTAIASGPGLRYLAWRTTVSGRGPVRWIGVSYPKAYLEVGGHTVAWQVWFIGISLVAALAFGWALPEHHL